MPQPQDVEDLAVALAGVYADAWQRLADEQQQLLTDWPSLHRSQRLARLRALQDLVEQLAGTVDEQALRFAVEELPRAFLYGAATAGATSLAGVDLDALAVLARDTYDDLLTATRGVRRSSKVLVRTLTRQHVTDLLVRGDTAVQAGRELAAALADRGLTAITYANGTRHGLAEYAEMVARTKSAQAYNDGTLGAVRAAGGGWVEVFDGTSCGWTGHDDPDKPNGTVRSVESALAHMLSHPRCRRSFGPRPDVRSAVAAARARPSTTAAERADQRMAEDARAVDVARRATARALDRRVQRDAARLLAEPGTRVTSPAYARRVAARNARLDRTARAEARARRLAARSRA